MARRSSGGLIDRQKPLSFTFDGRALQGFAGDTLASALVANDVTLLGRSFKYHRPRGLMAAGVEEPNALVALGEGAFWEPNSRATQVELYDGLVAQSQNRAPSLRFDWRSVNDLAARFLPAGFYYKTFLWPHWHRYEPAIRRAAGLGTAPAAPDPDRYLHHHAHCETLIVGSGPAGLAAALAASATGERVVLCEESAEMGGSLLWCPAEIDGKAATSFIAESLATLRQRGVKLLARTQAFGYYDHNLVGLLERCSDHLGPGRDGGRPRQRLWHLRAGRVILATGALERPLVFPDNDRPGIMLASAARAYMGRWAARPGTRALIACNNDEGYRAALAYLEGGGEVVGIVDSRSAGDSAWRRLLQEQGVPLYAGSVITRTFGRLAVKMVDVATLDGSNRQRLVCDVLLMAGGWAPTLHLYMHAGSKLAWDGVASSFVPDSSRQRVVAVGAARGSRDLATALAEGHVAGGGLGTPQQAQAAPAEMPLAAQWQVPKALAGHRRQWVDFQNDVTAKDVALAARENYASVEHLKRYTTMGMANDQGKTSNVNALALLGEATGRAIPDVGTTTFRPPFTPVTFGALAGERSGDLYVPRRYLPAHEAHVAAGAVFGDFGGWQRPDYYAPDGAEEEVAVEREMEAVRGKVGLFDGSTLGKVEVVGPDAALFVERLYLTRMDNLKPGRIRYGLMLTEHGIAMDDGVAARLAEDRFLLSPSTGASARVLAAMEEWLQCEWTDLKVAFSNVTSAWATFAIAGPEARRLLQGVGTDLDLSTSALPHMAFVEGKVAGFDCRVARVSFTGELQFEVSVAASDGPALWEALLRAGAAFAVQPVGIEAWMRLRTEKGYIHVGGDSDGTTFPQDLGFFVAKTKTENFIGRRSLTRSDAVREDRLQLVGLEGLDARRRLPVGAQILPTPDAQPPCRPDGRVTSSCLSKVLGRSVALGLLARGRARLGETVTCYWAGERLTAKVVPVTHYDPTGERLHA